MLTTMKQDAEKWEVDGESPKIVLSRELMNKLFAYACLANGEISGLGSVEVADGKITVTDICLLKQECGGANTDIDADALAKWNLDMIKEGKDTQKWRLWWHSHADMGVFFSGTDVTCASDLLNCFGDFVVSVVVNRKGEVYGRLNYALPPQSVFSKFSIVCAHCPVLVQDVSTIDTEAIKAEIAEKVSDNVIVVSSAVGGYASSYSLEEPMKSGTWDADRKEYVHDKRADLIWMANGKKWVRDPLWKRKEGSPSEDDDVPFSLGAVHPSSKKCEGCGEEGRTKFHVPSDNWLCKKCRREWHYTTQGRRTYYGHDIY